LRVNEVDNGGNSFYNGLAVQVQRRLAHGFEGSLSYTLVSCHRYQYGNAGGNLFLGNNSPSTLFNGDYKGNKGDSGLDQRHA